MKKLLSVLLVMAMLLTCVPLGALPVAAATSGTTGDCTWVLDDTILTIGGYGAMASYDFFEGAPWGTDITRVIIDDGVTTIGAYAFDWCENLLSVTLPNSITTIGEGAFVDCASLVSVSIPDSVTYIGNFLFAGCTSLTSVIVPDGITNIGIQMFTLCTSLTSVTIPGSVTSIGDYAFDGCTGLTSITIPDSITSVGVGAFRECDNLTAVYYSGNAADHWKINIGDENHALTNATWHYSFNNSSHSNSPNINSTIVNGTFENGTANGWVSTSASVVDYAAHTGKQGVHIQSDGGWSYCCSQTFQTVIGNTYTLSFWAKAVGADGLNVALDNDGKKTIKYIHPGNNGNGWKKHSFTFTANSTIASLDFIGPGTGNASALYVDDFALVEGATSTPDGTISEDIKNQISSINLGPYALKGAVIEVLGKEIPLINIEANIKLNLGDHLKLEKAKDGTISVLVGFDENAQANIDGSKNSTTYWSESYKEVKSMYQQVTGKKVDTTRLWNQFSAMRGKLKSINANLVVDVSASLMGYIEFVPQNGRYVFSEGGILASFEADADLRSYYGPFYVTLGIGVGADGSLFFTNENNKINPQISVKPSLTISAGVGAGGRKTYAEISAYGTLSAVIATNTASPFSAGIDLGVRGVAYLVGHKILHVKESFANMQLYPDFGGEWPVKLRTLASNTDLSTKAAYERFINAGEPLNRDYLRAANYKKSNATWKNASFVKDNSFLLNAPQLVSFDNGAMLLLWIDDTGEKTSKNLGSLMYSFYDGAVWSAPAVLFEDGTYNDIPYVCSDGTTAYFVWQKANIVFDEEIQASDMLPHFDLYFSSFDSNTQTFTERICLTPEDDSTFELLPTIDVADGVITVAWAENTDNNVFQLSGSNLIKTLTLDSALNASATTTVVSADKSVSDIGITDSAIYYTLLNESNNTLYCYNNGLTDTVQENILAFDCENGKVFYSSNRGFFAVDGDDIVAYDNIGALQSFVVKSNGEEYVLFTEQVNEDFSKTLYYNKLATNSDEWAGFEVYADRGKFIKDYVPVMLNDGTVYVAVNYTNDGEVQSGALVVEQCTEAIDITLSYVDFDETLLRDGVVDLQVGIVNNSSTVVNAVNLYVMDDEGNVIDTRVVGGTVPAFGNAELITAFTLPADASDRRYTFEAFPVGYSELDDSNNTVTSTFECVHIFSEAILTDIEATDTASAVTYHACDRCNAKSYIYTCGENLTHTYNDVCDATCNECGAERESAPSAEDVINPDVYHSITMEEETGNGLAFRFAMDIAGVEYEGNQYIPGTGTITLHGETHVLKRMGAIVSNDAEGVLDLDHLTAKTVNIEAKYLLDVEETTVAFAVRVINIPNTGKDVTVYARPYYVYECNGVEMIVYGDIDATTFQAEADKLE